MMSKSYTTPRKVLIALFILFAFSLNAQPKAKPGGQKPGPKGKATAKATLAADMDCLVKINNSAKPVSVKAYTPLDVTMNVGENTIEATSSDKKSSFRRTVTAKAEEKVIVEISFFDDAKFLDYIKNGNVQMVETAIKKDPSLATNADGSMSSSPLEVAIINSQPDMVKMLLSKGASWTTPDNIYPLHKSILYASYTKTAKDKQAPDKELVDLFLSKGCKITDKDDGGNTPLHCAVRAGKLDMVMMLVDKGADVNAKNDFEDTPLKIAMDKGMISIINYLKSKGALEK